MMIQNHRAEERREKLRKQVTLVTAIAIFGAVFLLSSLYTGFMIGAQWFGSSASTPWHMNNYIVIEAKYAYIFFGLATLAFGGLATGIALPTFFGLTKSKGHRLMSAGAFFVAILMTGLGFNTLDFMLGSFYWTNMQYPPPVQVPIIGSVDVWNYYFFFFVVPLWIGGFLIGMATTYSIYINQRKLGFAFKKRLTVKLNFPIIKLAEPKEYIAESKPATRQRKPIQTYSSYNTTSSAKAPSFRALGDSAPKP